MIATIHLSFPLALLAGTLSFISPCCLPLVPAYVAFLGGNASRPVFDAHGAAVRPAPPPRMPLLANGTAFVLGFSAVFVAFFYVFSALNVTVFIHYRNAVNIVAGVIVIGLALHVMGVVHLAPLSRERRLHLNLNTRGIFPAFLLGVTFAAGWTPCLGPQLGAILTVAAQQDFTGLPFMLTYCLGLAIPFLAVALMTDRVQGTLRALNKHMRAVTILSGAVLMIFGLLLVTDRITFLNRFALQSPFNV